MTTAVLQPIILVPRVFVSHSSRDNEFGTKLVKHLRNAYHDEDAVWYDSMGNRQGEGGLLPGDTWWKVIQEQIRSRYFFLLILSPDALASSWVQKEIKIASQEVAQQRKYIIPLLYRACEFPPEIAEFHCIDFRNPSPSAFIDALDTLLGTLNHTGMEIVRKKTFNEQLLDVRVDIGAQASPEEIIQQQLPSIEEAFHSGNWVKVLQDASALIRRVPGAIPSDLYEMQGFAALEEKDRELAEESLAAFFALVGDMGSRLAILLSYTEVLSKQGDDTGVRDYTYRIMDLVRGDAFWLKHVLRQFTRLAHVEVMSADDWSQPYLNHTYTYSGHARKVYDVTWSPDNKYVASAGADHTLQIWDPTSRSGRTILSCQHPKAVRGIAWSPQPVSGQGWYLATACADNNVYLWRILPEKAESELVSELKGHHDDVLSVAWSPDGKFLASAGNDRRVRLWDVQTGTIICTFKHADWVNAVAWSPKDDNGTYYVASASSDKTVKIWNPDTQQCVYTYIGHQKAVNSIIWSPNGTTIASASDDHTVQVWEYNTGNRGTIYRHHHDAVVKLARSPYGRRIISTSKNSFHLWYAATGDTILSNSQHAGWIQAVAWSPNGLFIALEGEDHNVQIWRAASDL